MDQVSASEEKTESDKGARSMDTEAKLQCLVIDSGAIIKGLQTHSIAKELWTVPQVISEIRDRRSKSNIPFNLKTRDPSPQALQDIFSFAKTTGDIYKLSSVDASVLALTLDLTRKYEEGTNLHLESAKEIETEIFGKDEKTQTEQAGHTEQESESRQAPKPEEALNEGNGEEVAIQDGEDEDGFKEVVRRPRRSKFRPKKNNWEAQWITPDNIEEVNKKYAGISDETKEKSIRVACVTTDYTMQNVILHIGMNLYSLDGYRITKLKRWAKKCYGCQEIVEDVGKMFCPKCGHDTLLRISYSVDKDGQRRYYEKKNFNVNQKGSKYAIPKYQRSGKNIILAEDEAFIVTNQNRPKKKKDIHDVDHEFFGQGKKRADVTRNLVAGHGRRNPNESRKRTGKKRKSKMV